MNALEELSTADGWFPFLFGSWRAFVGRPVFLAPFLEIQQQTLSIGPRLLGRSIPVTNGRYLGICTCRYLIVYYVIKPIVETSKLQAVVSGFEADEAYILMEDPAAIDPHQSLRSSIRSACFISIADDRLNDIQLLDARHCDGHWKLLCCHRKLIAQLSSRLCEYFKVDGRHWGIPKLPR